jgi:cell division protein FtsB
MRRQSRWFYFLSLILAISLMYVYVQRRDLYGRYQQYQQERDEVKALRGQLDASSKEESRLKDHVVGLDKDPVEIEAAIRRSKHLVRDGETIYRVETPVNAPTE